MDLLKECALSFQALLEYEYHFVIGRKGKLKGIAQIQQGMRGKDTFTNREYVDTI